MKKKVSFIMLFVFVCLLFSSCDGSKTPGDKTSGRKLDVHRVISIRTAGESAIGCELFSDEGNPVSDREMIEGIDSVSGFILFKENAERLKISFPGETPESFTLLSAASDTSGFKAYPKKDEFSFALPDEAGKYYFLVIIKWGGGNNDAYEENVGFSVTIIE